MITKTERKFHKYYYLIPLIYDLDILIDPCIKEIFEFIQYYSAP